MFVALPSEMNVVHAKLVSNSSFAQNAVVMVFLKFAVVRWARKGVALLTIYARTSYERIRALFERNNGFRLQILEIQLK